MSETFLELKKKKKKLQAVFSIVILQKKQNNCMRAMICARPDSYQIRENRRARLNLLQTTTADGHVLSQVLNQRVKRWF